MSETNQTLLSSSANSTDVNKKKFGRAGMAFILEGLKSVFLQIADAVKTVNGEEPDENGDITLTSVPYAQNLESESSRRNLGLFIMRTAGGEGSVSNDDSWLISLKGYSEHDGFVAEELTMEVVPMERADPITATLDRSTFIGYVDESATIQLVYSSAWSEDPELYGITVTGTPVAGDIINITYVKEERGAITVSDPQSFVATGWNLFDYTNGYARVVKYAYGYRVAGTYTALKYSATLTGSKTDISVVDGNFDVPADGYVWVTGGDASTTAIYATWEDWTENYSGTFAAYTESEIDLSSVMATYFPYGLLAVGSVADEIDLNLGQVISRVERMEYSEANRAIAAASGREYDFDEDYIYLARSTGIVNSITLDGSFSVHDHGIEMFMQTDLPVNCEILYGNNLKNKLERDVVTVSQQTLTESQKSQIRDNIGAEKAGVLTGLLVIENKTVFDNKTIASGSFEDVSYSVSKAGYTPIAVVGYNVSNGTSSGSGRTNTVLTKLYISSNNLTVSMKNTSGSSVKVKLNVYILYKKNIA